MNWSGKQKCWIWLAQTTNLAHFNEFFVFRTMGVGVCHILYDRSAESPRDSDKPLRLFLNEHICTLNIICMHIWGSRRQAKAPGCFWVVVLT